MAEGIQKNEQRFLIGKQRNKADIPTAFSTKNGCSGTHSPVRVVVYPLG